MPTTNVKYRFGVGLSSSTRNLDRIPRLARVADDAGLDFVSFQDHLYNPYWDDSWTLLTAVGMSTERIGLQLATATLPLRPPAALAKAAATLQRLTDGRLELGIGSGGPQYAAGIESLGGAPRTGAAGVDLVDEAIAAMRLLWQAGPAESAPPQHQVEQIQRTYDEYVLPTEWPAVSFRGTQVGLHEALLPPGPATEIPILVGATRPRMARLAGRAGDGWIVSHGRMSDAELLALHDTIDEGAQQAGRDPATLVRQFNRFGTIGLEPVHLGPRPGPAGPPTWWVDELVRCCCDLRMNTINLWLGDDEQQLEVYATEIVPQVRAALQRVSTP